MFRPLSYRASIHIGDHNSQTDYLSHVQSLQTLCITTSHLAEYTILPNLPRSLAFYRIRQAECKVTEQSCRDEGKQ